MARQRIDAPRVLRPGDILAVADSREQLPYDLAPLRTMVGTLGEGDYSLAGAEGEVRVERKSLPDFLSCCGRERPRFLRELRRLAGFRYRLIVLEASWRDLEAGDWQGCVKPSAVVGSVLSWSAEYCPILLAGDRAGGQRACRGYLWLCARHLHERIRGFADMLPVPGRNGT